VAATGPRIPWRRALVVAGGAAAAAAIAYSLWVVTTYAPGPSRAAVAGAVPRDPAQLAVGRKVYEQQCASCHGANLEGQPNWRERLPNGRMPAPPHDESGHTWHHPDEVLFGITKHGLVPGKYAPPKYESDMPGFGGVLSDDEIRAVLAYIESTWSLKVRGWRADMLREAAAARK
jgi:mono/diheme cytochrome c family protein